MSQITIILVPYYQTFCAESDRPYCMNYTNASGELAVTRFTYNNREQNDHAFYQQITGNRSSKNFHHFDKRGRMVRKNREYNDGETSEEVYIYDNNGRLIQETFVSSNGPEGETLYKYDTEGNASTMVCNGYKGWLEGVINFDFDMEGKRLAGRIFKDGSPIGTIEYQYNRRGNLIQEHWDLGDWSQTLRYVYEQVGD